MVINLSLHIKSYLNPKKQVRDPATFLGNPLSFPTLFQQMRISQFWAAV